MSQAELPEATVDQAGSESTPPDQLILDISRKPLINLVWAGTTLILLGSLIVFFRRRDDLFREQTEP